MFDEKILYAMLNVLGHVGSDVLVEHIGVFVGIRMV